jgi:hypothetical protein
MDHMFRWRCRDCLVDLSNRKERRQHCCCLNNWVCSGHNIKVNYCAGQCLDCGWGGCVCVTHHCCCQEKDMIGIRFHQWVHEFIDKTQINDPI